MKRKSWQKVAAVTLGIFVAVMLVACGSTTEYVREEAPKPNPDTDKFLILPVYLSLPGDELKQSAALFGGVVKAFGDSAVSLQPIQPVLDAAGFGWMPYSMAYGMYWMARNERWDFADSGNAEYAKIAQEMSKFIGTVTKELKLDFEPKYLVVASIYSYGGFLMASKIRYIGGLYNIPEGKIDKVFVSEKMTVYKEAMMLAEMATFGDKLYAIFFPSEEEEG